MAKLKKRSNVQRNRVTQRGKARKAAKSTRGKASKRTVARAKRERMGSCTEKSTADETARRTCNNYYGI